MNDMPKGWRIGDAGTTVFGPKTADGSPAEVIAANLKRGHARIIRAAPELYAELAKLLPVLESMPAPKPGQVDWPRLAHGVRIALANARGE